MPPKVRKVDPEVLKVIYFLINKNIIILLLSNNLMIGGLRMNIGYGRSYNNYHRFDIYFFYLILSNTNLGSTTC